MVDAWKSNPMPHRALAGPWLGITMFTDKVVPQRVIDDVMSSFSQ